MKLKMAIAAVALAFLGATSAYAQQPAELSITLYIPDPGNPPTFLSPGDTQTASPTGEVWFSGLIRNDTDAPDFPGGPLAITINADSISAPAGVGTELPQQDPELTNFPLTLGPGGSLFVENLFGLKLNGQQTSFSGTYAVESDLLDENGIPRTFEATYNVNVQVVVPEPGAMALLVSGLVGGSLFMMRRRK